ncbi:MAG: hypothetical protein MHM6MM_000014 [Cercozoa sp. M6MM]
MIKERATQTSAASSTRTHTEVYSQHRSIGIQVGSSHATAADKVDSSLVSQVARILLRLKYETVKVQHETVRQRGRVRQHQKPVLRAQKKTRAKKKTSPKKKKGATVCSQCGQVFEKYQGLNAHLKVHRNAERRAQQAAAAAAAASAAAAGAPVVAAAGMQSSQ